MKVAKIVAPNILTALDSMDIVVVRTAGDGCSHT